MVEEVITSGAEPSYRVFFGSTEAPIYPEHALLDADAERVSRDPVEQLRLWRFAPAEQFRSFLTFEKLNQPLASTVYSYLASRTRLLEYQFKPALKLLDNPYSRILIADEVGLGKTIEAGIILTELHARQSLNRVLITCPSALRPKWKDEMRRRFDWDFDVLARGRAASPPCRLSRSPRPAASHHRVARGTSQCRDAGDAADRTP